MKVVIPLRRVLLELSYLHVNRGPSSKSASTSHSVAAYRPERGLRLREVGREIYLKFVAAAIFHLFLVGSLLNRIAVSSCEPEYFLLRKRSLGGLDLYRQQLNEEYIENLIGFSKSTVTKTSLLHRACESDN